MRASVLGILLCLGITVAAPARSEAEPPVPVQETKGPSPGGAALRSLILPGWGQAANGKWLKGAAALGAYAGFLGWSVSLHQDRQDALGRMHAAVDETERLYWKNEADRLESERNGKYWLAGLVMLVSMADAYVDGYLRDFDKRMDADVGWIPVGDEGAWGLRVTAFLDGDDASRGRRSR